MRRLPQELIYYGHHSVIIKFVPSVGGNMRGNYMEVHDVLGTSEELFIRFPGTSVNEPFPYSWELA